MINQQFCLSNKSSFQLKNLRRQYHQQLSALIMAILFYCYFQILTNTPQSFNLTLKCHNLILLNNCSDIQQLRDNSMIQIPPSPQPNNTKANIKISLPSVFALTDEVQLEIVGYRFDPIQRLSSTKQSSKLGIQNIGDVASKIKEEIRRSNNFFQEKDWKSLQREILPFTFELQIVVKVHRINNPSIEAKSIYQRSKGLFHTIQVDITKDNQTILGERINHQAKSVIVSLKNHKFPQPNCEISFAPQKLFNPHLFIKTVSKQKYIQYYTKGVYEYFHYGDQSFSDHGWGCAYRSLQTLLSWLNLQNHVKLPKMLTILQIQQLIDRINLGSKQKLRNTKQWIGATEVSWVVKHLTNYDCRIVHISDGKKIIQECQMFREHFEKVGSPIMYGGGEYAYSIVGLNYSWKLGQCQFLILDPHYPGQDTMDKILQKKGLCWRKPQQMFKKGVFYNFCLPII